MFRNLQGLRGIAALLVFFHHSLAHFLAMGLSFTPFERVAKYGFMGVDVFFVISGFVIAKSIDKPVEMPILAINFIKKRFLRIFLGYWPMFALAWVVHVFYHSERLEHIDLLGSFSLLNVRMGSLLISPSWSLTFELFFYALVSLLILMKIKQIRTLIAYSILIVLKINVLGNGQSLLLDFFFLHWFLNSLVVFTCGGIEMYCLKDSQG